MPLVMVQVFVILNMAFRVVIEELCPSSPFLCVVPFCTYLDDDDEDIGILVKLASCFCKSI